MDSTAREQDAWCTLLRAPGIGPRTLNPLLAQCESAQALIESPPPEAPAELREYLHTPDLRGVDRDLAWLDESGHHLLTLNDPRYPGSLRELSDPPSALFLNGDQDLLGLAQLAIVGSRHPTTGGRQNAEAFARELAASGLAISSGLATGIDTAAHLGALAVDGLTVAVVGTGPDRIYPAANQELAHRIAAQGLIVSEFPTGTPPRRGNFPRRNRVLAGLALGTLVVEAALQSGSLITARLAGENGREVFALPGSIHNPLARGCHALIRDGAKLVETATDVFEELAGQLGRKPPSRGPLQQTDERPPDPQHAAVLEALGHDPRTTDELVALTGFPAAEVSSILLLLEMQGHVSSESGGQFTRLGNMPE